jgi:hypothetical protein
VTPDALGTSHKAEIEKWWPIIKAASIKGGMIPTPAPVGERPIALGHHRFEWLYVTGFVEPATTFAKLRRRGVGRDLAAQTAGSPHGPWRFSQSPAPPSLSPTPHLPRARLAYPRAQQTD